MYINTYKIDNKNLLYKKKEKKLNNNKKREKTTAFHESNKEVCELTP